MCGLLLPEHPNIATTYALILQNEDNKTIIPIKSKKDIPAQSYLQYRVKIVISEYVDGSDLFDVINSKKGRRNRNKGSKLAIRIGKQLVPALKYFHDNQILFRDLKPSNIMINSSGMIKVVDFGLVKFIGDLARSYSCVGARYFLSPEISTDVGIQDKHKHNGHTYQTDLWGLGITLMNLTLNATFDYLWKEHQGSKSTEFEKPTKFGKYSYSCWFAQMDETEKKTLLLQALNNKIDPNAYNEVERDHLINIIIGLTKDEPDERITLAEVEEQLNQADPPEPLPAITELA